MAAPEMNQQQQQKEQKQQATGRGDGSNTKVDNVAESATSKQGESQVAMKLAQFYEGKNIFVTGATGFIGKVCLLKLLISLENCGTIYVLMRGKKGLTAQQRLKKMLNEEPFNISNVKRNQHLMDPKIPFDPTTAYNCEAALAKLAQSASNLITKLVAVEGDMSRQHLGLSEQDQTTLAEQVDVVFNIAASVQFDAPLKQNLRDNYTGANNMLNLARTFKRLISLVHVSTFYSNSHMKYIEEKVVPMERDCEKVAQLIEWLPDNMCETLVANKQLMENRPNTYIFTKAMTENLVMKYEGQLPLAIVRPSIVTPSVKEPCAGWVDNVNGPMGLGLLASLGILRNIDWNYWGVSDFIPVDFVVNSMLAVGERTARKYPREIKVYNCSSSSLNPTTWGQVFETLRAESLKAPPYKMLRVPINVPKHRRANKLQFGLTKISELIFAYFIDLILTICGQKRLLTRLTAKLHHGYRILRPFTTSEYTCANDNLQAALEELQDEDKQEFDFNIEKLNWVENFQASYYGARRRLLKEEVSNVPAALFKMRILQSVEWIFTLMLSALIAFSSYRLYTGYLNTNHPHIHNHHLHTANSIYV